MPKMKTHRGAAKRFKVTGRGKLVKSSSFKRHKLGHKTAKQKRHLRKAEVLTHADQKRMEKLLPYR